MILAPLLAALGATSSAPCPGLPPGDAHFLIVGRNVPPAASRLDALQYADEDALSMQRTAITQFCFRPDQVTLLVDDDATADNVLETLAARARTRTGRMFVYVSAHGSRAEGVQLDRALPWSQLEEAIDAVDASQTFVFLDTCDSASFVESRRGQHKGTVQIAPRVDPGRFYLTASTGRAFERHLLQGGVATRDFLAIIHGFGTEDTARTITSIDVCRILGVHQNLSGECDHEIKGSGGVILVPVRRPPGWLQVDEGQHAGQWSYILGTELDGAGVWFPIRAIDLGGSTAQSRDGLPPGPYRLRRIHSERRRCDIARVTIREGEVASLAPPDWTPEPAHCAWLEAREKNVPARPGHALSVGIGLVAPWIDSAVVGPHLRLGFEDHGVPGYRAGVGLSVSWLREDVALDPAAHRLSAVDVAGALYWDPLYATLGALDVYGGVEAGGAWTRVARPAQGDAVSGLAGVAAGRLGTALRITSSLLLDVSGAVGLRSFRWQGELVARPWAGLTIGGILGVD